MNAFLKIIMHASICSLLFVQHAVFASDKTEYAKIEVKCHVVLADNSETIGFWNVSDKRFQNVNDFQQSIVGVKLPASNRDKIAITKAYQCVPEEKSFSSPQARQLDKKLLR